MTSRDKNAKQKKAPSLSSEQQALLCLSLFIHRYLATVYKGEDLDLTSISLLQEIAQHNFEPFTSGGRVRFPRSAEEMKLMRGCNAFSLSQATGIPRETARRKLKQLVKLGWIEQHNRHGLFVTAQWMDRLCSEEVSELLAGFRDTAKQVEKLLG